MKTVIHMITLPTCVPLKIVCFENQIRPTKLNVMSKISKAKVNTSTLQEHRNGEDWTKHSQANRKHEFV